MIVVDTSVVLAVLLIEPERTTILKRTRGKRILAAPSLGWEVGNALVALVRRRRADYPAVERAWRSFGRIHLAYANCDISAALRLATEASLYAYDAYVIETARAAGAPLLTLDKKQQAVAAERGVEILEIT
ncbi:MAG: type II toxin-antitoxin system VapC family toxin [Candidatus Omnitrophota bacterium]